MAGIKFRKTKDGREFADVTTSIPKDLFNDAMRELTNHKNCIKLQDWIRELLNDACNRPRIR